MLLAQGRGDLWVMPDTAPWNVAHRVSKGETVFMLARRYHVPPAILADANGLTYNDGLKENTTLIIPLGAYNLQTTRPANMMDARSLYYKVEPGDDLYNISRRAGVAKKILAQWNNLPDGQVRPGQILLVGWVLFDASATGTAMATSPTSSAVNNTPRNTAPARTAPRDTPRYIMQSTQSRPPVQQQQPPVAAPVTPAMSGEEPEEDSASAPSRPSGSLESLYQEQTLDGQNVVTEKGTAGFYKVTTTAKGVAALAFHNKAAKGTIIKVKNINNGRYVYVKVVGPVPLTKQYYNCIIGLSDKVQAVLGVRDARMFCELSYGPY